MFEKQNGLVKDWALKPYYLGLNSCLAITSCVALCNYLTSLCLRFLICKIEIITVLGVVRIE